MSPPFCMSHHTPLSCFQMTKSRAHRLSEVVPPGLAPPAPVFFTGRQTLPSRLDPTVLPAILLSKILDRGYLSHPEQSVPSPSTCVASMKCPTPDSPGHTYTFSDPSPRHPWKSRTKGDLRCSPSVRPERALLCA